jgi:hypothetical protein
MVVITMNDGGYDYLTPLTWDQNGLIYCETHGYPYVIVDDFEGKPAGFAKIDNMLAVCKENPEVEWIFWKDADGLITNFNIKLEDIVDNDYHVMLTTYWNGINNGMMMVRNSEQGRAWLEMIMSKFPEYARHPVQDQQVMIDTFEEWKHIIKIVPQRTFNSACFSDGAHRGAYTTTLDTLGTDGQWQQGDFIMHWPGQDPSLRLMLARKYINRVLLAEVKSSSRKKPIYRVGDI